MRGMDLFTLSIKLSSLFTLTDSTASLLFGRFNLFLDLCPNGSGSRSCGLRLCRVSATHGFGFPLTDPLPHEGRAVGFSHITAVHEQINDGNITPIVIDLTFPISKPIEQAWTHIPVSLEGKPCSIMDVVAMAPDFAVLC